MTIGIKYKGITTEIGPGSILHALFSTISSNLEPEGWGSHYPVLMNKFYQEGRLCEDDAIEACRELREIKERLKEYGPDKVVWDIEDVSAAPPWGNDVGQQITDLSHYFVTNSKRDLIDILIENITCLYEMGGHLEIISYLNQE